MPAARRPARSSTARSTSATTVGQVADLLDILAPPQLAQPWDNVGLLAGDRAARCRSVLLCVDLTPPVLHEAVEGRCQLALVYHPPLFRPVQRLLADSKNTDAIVYRAIAAGVAIYSPHTALDAAPGGTNDVLAALCGLSEVEPFEYPAPPVSRTKVVTFVPPARVDHVAGAMAAAGAGRIGEYEHCSYRLAGQGTFFGTESTQPRVGRRGRLEKVDEIRLEMVAPDRLLPEIIDALLRAHPYEEPAYDLYPLAEPPSFGIGRVGRLPARSTLGRLAAGLKKVTSSKVAAIVGRAGTPIRRAAVCVGAAGRLPLEKPRTADCDVIVTGEIRHHDALAILRAGKTAIALGHAESERPVLPVLAARLKARFPGLRIAISRQDVPPFVPA